MNDAAQKLSDLSAVRRELGRKQMDAMPDRKPDVDPALMMAAARIIDKLYAAGDFGEGDRPADWLAAKTLDLSECLQGVLEDWQYAEHREEIIRRPKWS